MFKQGYVSKGHPSQSAKTYKSSIGLQGQSPSLHVHSRIPPSHSHPHEYGHESVALATPMKESIIAMAIIKVKIFDFIFSPYLIDFV